MSNERFYYLKARKRRFLRLGNGDDLPLLNGSGGGYDFPCLPRQLKENWEEDLENPGTLKYIGPSYSSLAEGLKLGLITKND